MTRSFSPSRTHLHNVVVVVVVVEREVLRLAPPWRPPVRDSMLSRWRKQQSSGLLATICR